MESIKIAIVGAGYAGLSACWHLLQKRAVEITLFDGHGIGAGASGASTGLLHPYPAKSARLSHRAYEAMEESFRLIEVAEKSSFVPVASSTGILRLALTEEQRQSFLHVGEDVEYWDEEKVRFKVPQARSLGGLWVPQGKTVFSKLYLQGLWRACQSKGVHLSHQSIEDIACLADFDCVVLANGSEILRYELCSELPLKKRKGQALLCRWPHEEKKVFCSLIGSGHLSLTEDPSVCLLGSTYEEEFDPLEAIALREKIGVFFPPALSFEILGVRSGVRIAPKIGYLPFVQKVAPKIWVFTGLGSRGLLYHGLFGKELAESIFSEFKV